MASGLDRLADLWSRSTGGTDVAVDPGDHAKRQDVWFSGSRPAGMADAGAWFRGAVDARKESALLFFVGGPGAGKSHAAAELVEEFEILDFPTDGLAQRTYRYKAAGKQVILVNDATIRNISDARPELVENVSAVLAQQDHLIACVNRGVLVEELARATEYVSESSVSTDLLRWVNNPREDFALSGDFRLEIGTDTSDYLAVAELFAGPTKIASICVVYVDVCSMFEQSPVVNFHASTAVSVRDVRASPYRIAQFPKRQAINCSDFPAGNLLQQVIHDLSSRFDSDLSGTDPVTANILSLKSDQCQSGVLSVLRAAELVSGQRFTYRDLWGAVARSVLGDLPERESRDDALRQLAHRRDYSEAPFVEVQRAAGARFSQALYGASDESPRAKAASKNRNPVVRLTWAVDPARDSRPRRQEGVSGLENDWSARVRDAFSSYDNSNSPLELVLESDKDSHFASVVTPFDEAVDRAYQLRLDEVRKKPREKSAAIAWYSRYLTRLYATSHGYPAFWEEVTCWTDAWNMPGQLPGRLEAGIRTLLIPKRNPAIANSRSLMPILDSRTLPLVGISQRPRIAITANNVDFESEISGESVFVVLNEGSSRISKMALDFALIREALAASADGPGLTEFSEETGPRLERFRASRLIPKEVSNRSQYVIAHGNEETVFTVQIEKESQVER